MISGQPVFGELFPAIHANRLSVLLDVAEKVAREYFNGTITCHRTPFGWKVMFGFPNGPAELERIREYSTLGQALEALLLESITYAIRGRPAAVPQQQWQPAVTPGNVPVGAPTGAVGPTR